MRGLILVVGSTILSATLVFPVRGQSRLFGNLRRMLPADVDRTYALVLGDVDGDGDLDALLGGDLPPANAGQSRLYLNRGSGIFTDATAQLPASVDIVEAVALGDVDG